jgi:hypothetical protein
MESAHAGEEWISEGNFAVASLDIRLRRATLVIWLERSRLVCAWRAITRVFKSGEAHQVRKLADVLAFIQRFDRVNRPRIEAVRLSSGPNVPVARLSSDREIAALLASYSAGANSGT